MLQIFSKEEIKLREQRSKEEEKVEGSNKKF